ncbi:MAG: type II secretion system F family protein [Thaumarchaeota archaeon]|nr:type II secretion system F family protein [Nitrososphaerota archaeon]
MKSADGSTEDDLTPAADPRATGGRRQGKRPAKKQGGKQAPKQGGFTRSYWRKAYALLDPRMEPLYKRFGKMEDQVRKAGIRLTYRVYLCGVVFTAIIAAVTAGVVATVLTELLRVSLVDRILFPFLGVIIGGGATFGIGIINPRIKFSGRKRRIDEDLVFVVSRMAVLSASGMTIEAVIKQVAADDSNDLVTQEFRKIVRDMNLLGMDLTQALQEERRRSPSEVFGSFLDGMISTSASGADIQSYMVKASKTLMDDKRLKTRSFSETLGVVAEMYTTILVVMPLILIILFAVMGVIAGSLGGISITLLIQLVVYVMVPMGGIMIMVIADGIMPKR